MYIACAGLVLATLVAFLIPKLYSTQVQLMPPDSKSTNTLALMAGLSGKGDVGGLGAFAGDLIGMKSTGALFIGVLQSRTVEDHIVQRFDLKKVYGVRLEELARQKLAEGTSITEERKSGIISMNVTDRDAKRAAAIASAYVEELDALITQLSTSSARRERVFLEQRLSSVRQDLDSAAKDFSQFATKNGTIDIGEQGKAMVGAAAALEGQLIAAQSELEGLKQIYTDSNVRVRATQARILELQHQLEKFSGKPEPAYDPNRNSSSEIYPSLRQLPVLGVPYADFFRRLKIQEAVFETLTKEFELAKVEEAKEIPTVKVLDSPEVPERKSYPPRLQIMIVGTLLALVFGIVWILSRDRWLEIAPEDPGKQLALEIFHGLKEWTPWSASNGSNGGSSGLARNDSATNVDEPTRK
jgi:capsule polysaccharide export protein KpsE/RkpR